MKIVSKAEIFRKIPREVMSSIMKIVDQGEVPANSDVVCCDHPQEHVVASNICGELFWFFLCDACLANTQDREFISVKNRLPITLVPGTCVLLANAYADIGASDRRTPTRVRLAN